MKRLPRVVLVMLTLALSGGAAVAGDPPTRLTGLARLGGKLAVSVGVPDLFRPVDAQRLTSGFATRVLLRMTIFKEPGREPVAHAVRLTEVVYDVWEERFQIRVDASAMEREVVKDPVLAIDRATSLRAFPVVDQARLAPGATYRLVVVADLNPLAPEVVAEVRRWLARPPGQGRLATGDSFFGSMVSIFVNPRVEESDRRVQFLSQPFVWEAGP